MKRLIACAILLAVLSSGCAQKPVTHVYSSEDVDVLFLEKALKRPIQMTAETVIIDTRSDFDYAVVHAPGSVHLHFTDFTEAPDSGKLKNDLEPETRRLARMGISPQTPVLVVGYGPRGPGEEASVAWALLYFGVRDVQVAELDSLGLHYSIMQTEPRPNATEWAPDLHAKLMADRDEVIHIATNHGADSATSHIIDVRTSNEFFSKSRDLKYNLPDLRAVNIEWHEFFTPQGRPNPEMRKKLQAIGIEPSHRIVVISNKGFRSSAVAFALTAMGFANVGNYAGGYTDLVRHPLH